MATTIGERIRAVRKARKMNQADFAKLIGLGTSTLAMMEVDKRTVGDRHIKVICAVCNVREEWLRTGEGEMFTAADGDALFESFATKFAWTPFQRDMARLLLQLNNEDLHLVLYVVHKLADKTRGLTLESRTHVAAPDDFQTRVNAYREAKQALRTKAKEQYQADLASLQDRYGVTDEPLGEQGGGSGGAIARPNGFCRLHIYTRPNEFGGLVIRDD